MVYKIYTKQEIITCLCRVNKVLEEKPNDNNPFLNEAQKLFISALEIEDDQKFISIKNQQNILQALRSAVNGDDYVDRIPGSAAAIRSIFITSDAVARFVEEAAKRYSEEVEKYIKKTEQLKKVKALHALQIKVLSGLIQQSSGGAEYQVSVEYYTVVMALSYVLVKSKYFSIQDISTVYDNVLLYSQDSKEIAKFVHDYSVFPVTDKQESDFRDLSCGFKLGGFERYFLDIYKKSITESNSTQLEEVEITSVVEKVMDNLRGAY
jgi:hypothetical protein